MVTRRGFLGMLAALPVVTALAGVRLPSKFDTAWRPMEGDFTTENLRYKCTERWSVQSTTDWRAIYGSTA